MSGKRGKYSTKIRTPYSILPTLSRPWPLVKANFSCNNHTLPQPVLCLIDSGADVSIIRKDVARELGFKLLKKDISGKGWGVSNNYQYWNLPHPITTLIEGREYLFNFQVIDSRTSLWPCILGHNTLFKVAKITFKTFKQHFDLSFRLDIN